MAMSDQQHDVIHALAVGIKHAAQAGATDTCERLAVAITDVLAGVPCADNDPPSEDRVESSR